MSADDCMWRFARAVEAFERANEPWPIVAFLAGRADRLMAKAHRTDDSDVHWLEGRALDQFVDALHDLIDAYDDLPFDVRFPLGGAA